MTYDAETKYLTPLYVGEKMSNSRDLGKKFLLKLNHPYPATNSKHPSTNWLARVHLVVVFKTKVLHLKIENTLIKDTNGKRKFKRMLSFLFVGKGKLFVIKLSFEEFNFVSFAAERLVCFEATKAVSF